MTLLMRQKSELRHPVQRNQVCYVLEHTMALK